MNALRRIARVLWTSMEARPWLWTLSMLLPLVAVPAIDLTVSGWFYDPAWRGFPLRVDPVFEWFRKEMPVFLFGFAGFVVVAWAAAEMLGRAVCGVTRRIGAYVVLSLALGPGLVVNVLLKDSWGRPRPSTLREFGGTNHYVPPLVISDQCDDNCSFSSGHGALGFWTFAIALLAPPAWRSWAVAAALAFGIVVGLVRIAQGGHFLSDVAFSAVITVGLSLWLYRRILVPGPTASSKNNHPPMGESA